MSHHDDNHQPDGPREKLRAWDAHGREGDLPDHVVANLEAMDAAGDLKPDDQELLRAYERAHQDNPPPPPQAVVDFDEPIGEIRRHPTEEVVTQVKVKRSGSTHAASTQPVSVAVSGLPQGVLKAVEPATFGPGQARSHVAMRFTPAPAAPAAAAAAPMSGKADLVATAELAAGANASQQFTVVDGDGPAPPPPAHPFHLHGVDLGPLPFLLGMSMGHNLASLAAWKSAIGRAPLCCSGGSHNGGRTATWQGVRGGDKGTIGNGTQLDIAGHSTNLSDAFDVIPPGPGLIVATWRTVPDNVQASDYADLADGSHDADAYIMGWNAWLLMKGRGYRGAQLIVRADKEYNGGGYGVTEQNAPQRAKWLARWIGRFNAGYLDAGADDRARHVLGLARHDQLGPLEAHVPVGPTGAVMVDAIDVSMHPPAQGLSALVGKPFDEQVAGVRAWIQGDFDGRPCYAPDHKDARYSGLAAAKAHGVLISNFESSPRDDDDLACPISAAAWKGLFDFWRENAAMVGGVGVYNHTALDQSLAVPNWGAGVDALVRLAKGG